MEEREPYRFLGGIEREISVVCEEKYDAPNLDIFCRGLGQTAWARYQLCGGGYDFQEYFHPELATPECTSVSAVVAYDEAALVAFNEARKTIESMGHPLRLYANGSELPTTQYPKKQSLRYWGHHENYIQPHFYIRPSVLEFGILAREIVLTGTGGVNQKGEFVRSRRVEMPEVRLDKNGRLEVRKVDATRHPFTTALRMDVVVCLLHLASVGVKLPAPKKLPTPKVIRELRADPYQKVALDNGEELSPVGYMLWLREQMLEELAKENFPAATRQSAERFVLVMEQYDRGEIALVPYLEWAAKKFLLEHARAKYLEKGIKENDLIDRLHAIDLQWHDIDPERSVYMEMLGREHLALPFSQEEWERAHNFFPPNDTRAYPRSVVLRMGEKLDLRVAIGDEKNVSWDQATVELPSILGQDDYDSYAFEFPDPWNSNVNIELFERMGPSCGRAFREVRAVIGPPAVRVKVMDPAGR